MALSNKAVLVNLFLNDSLELIMVISDVELQAANEQGSIEFFYLFSNATIMARLKNSVNLKFQ